MSEQDIVTVNNMSFSRADRDIFNDISLSIPRGKIVAIMGPSGTGKTTLLRLIGALLTPKTGNISVFGEFIHRLKQKKRYALRQRMGFLFQNGALFTNISAFDNVAFPLREHTNLSEQMIRDIVLMKLQAVGLRGARDLMPTELSGGMARRVALARAIALDPELVLYDEPFTGQDPIGKAILVELIKTINQALGLTSILVSHDVQETLSIADYVYLLADGQIMGQGSANEIKQSDDPSIKQFIHGLADGVVPFHYPATAYKNDLLEDPL